MDSINNETFSNITLTTMPTSLKLRSQPWTTSGDEFIAAVVCLALLSLLGLFGNSTVISIISFARHRGQRSPVQLFLLHLAISDMMVCVLCIPLTIWVNFHFPEKSNSYDGIVCKFTRFLQYLAPSSSIALLTTISIDRFYSLVKPFKSKTFFLRAKPMIVTAWIYAALIFLPAFYFSNTSKLVTETGIFYYCATVPNDNFAGLVYLIFLFLAAFLIPALTLGILYFRVARKVWVRERKISRHGDSIMSRHRVIIERSKKRVTQMLLTVVVVFTVCWLPFVLYTGFIERWVAPFPNPSDGVRFITYCIGLFNSVCNPVIYFFNSEGFRKESLKNVCLESSSSGKNAFGKVSENTVTTHTSRSRTLSKLSIIIPPIMTRERRPTQETRKMSDIAAPVEPKVYDTKL